MNAPDWSVIENMRNAQRYSDLCNEAELQNRIEAERDIDTNRVCSAIRNCDLSPAQVHQIMCTLACEMKRRGWHEVAVAAVEDAGDV